MMNYKGYTIWHNELQGWMLQDGYQILGVYETLKGAKCKASWLYRQSRDSL